jgi:hypothetical protein
VIIFGETMDHDSAYGGVNATVLNSLQAGAIGCGGQISQCGRGGKVRACSRPLLSFLFHEICFGVMVACRSFRVLQRS